ncbi:MAG: acyl-CoA carboxylase subunit beta [Anaerolineaceae bacterium]|nr:acyl-CoA carboxylase subunit beta [Anaerolineaceae bacterium]
MIEDPRIVELREKREKTLLAGGEKRIAKQHAKGKFTARERLDFLLDPDSFQELEPYVLQRSDPLGITREKIPGDGVVTGYGQIEGRTVYVYAQDFTVQGGALGEMQGKKISRVMDLAVQNGAPIIGLIDSGGARIQEGVFSLGGYAEVFQRNARYSGVVPQISLVLGPCAGGAAYSPAVTDLIIMVEKQSYMFLTGPNVIKTVTGEEIDFEGLGGAQVHMETSGTAHLTTQDEKSAIAAARLLLSYLPANNIENAPFIQNQDPLDRMDEKLNSIIPIDPGMPYRMHEIIESVVDQGSFQEIQDRFAANAITGFARLGGFSVGIVAQEPSVLAGVLDIDSSDKVARFVRLCDSFNLPLITLIDSPGFLPGISQEHGGVIRHGAKVLYAYSEATVPKISVVTRKAYGGAYVVLNSKYMGADFYYAWPSAEIAVMGPEGAANVLFRRQIQDADDPDTERERLTNEYRERFLNPYAAAEAGLIDNVIEPRETRPVLIKALKALQNKHQSVLPRKHGNIPL